MPMHHWNPFSKERRTERKDQIIGWLMLLGIIFALGGGWLLVMFAFVARGGGADQIFLIVRWVPLIGILMYVGGLVYGIYSEKTELQGPRNLKRHCRIIARYAITRENLMVTDEASFEYLDRPKFYVKILDPVDGSVEYQCRPEVFFNCGEGMIGDAEVQGVWLGAFRPNLQASSENMGQRF